MLIYNGVKQIISVTIQKDKPYGMEHLAPTHDTASLHSQLNYSTFSEGI